MRVVYLPSAKADVRRLHAFLDEKNPAAAVNAIRAIEERLALLPENPYMGKSIGSGLRQIVIKFGRGAYIVNYRAEDELTIVTRIWHSREKRT